MLDISKIDNFRKELAKQINDKVLKHHVAKDVFLRGFIIGRKITPNGLKRFGKWRTYKNKNGFFEEFSWRGKLIQKFKYDF